MKASVGDHIVLRGLGTDEPDRRGEIVEVLGEAGAPPYLVRWPDGHESLYIGKTDAFVDHAVHRPSALRLGRSVRFEQRDRRRAMKASIGDYVVLRALGTDERERRGEIVEVLGESGAPPYVVRWPDGHESLFIGSINAFVDHAVHYRQSAA
jgi:Domain of unknown function (DUF1918)